MTAFLKIEIVNSIITIHILEFSDAYSFTIPSFHNDKTADYFDGYNLTIAVYIKYSVACFFSLCIRKPKPI